MINSTRENISSLQLLKIKIFKQKPFELNLRLVWKKK